MQSDFDSINLDDLQKQVSALNLQDTREWCDLPIDIIQYLADKLGIIELLTIRKICKAWRSATSKSTGAAESSPNREPWLLLCGLEPPDCKLIHESNSKQYSIPIPDLIGEQIVASKHGWLLCFPGHGMFFLCPLTGAKILLPDPPADFLNASFSSDPLSPDCIVVILGYKYENNQRIVRCYELRRGYTDWIQRGDSHHNYDWEKPECAVFHDGVFYFCSNNDKVFRYNSREGILSRCGHLCPFRSRSGGESLPWRRDREGRFGKYEKMMKRLGIGEEDRLTTIGTVINGDDYKVIMVPWQYYEEEEDRWKWEHRKEKTPYAAWIQPRLHWVDEDYKW